MNSEEAYGIDKFIIIGVTDVRIQKGIIEENCIDDSDFQILLEKITPRPAIQTGQVKLIGKLFGYIFISKSNVERVYEISEDYCCKKSQVLSGQAFTRKGTSNYVLKQENRKSIIMKNISLGIGRTSIDPLLAIEEKTAIEKDKYFNVKQEDIFNFYCDNNDGKYTIGFGDHLFGFIPYVVNNNAIILYTLHGERIGYKHGCQTVSDKAIFLDFDYSSPKRRLQKDDFAVLVNNQGYYATICLVEAKSRAHGSERDEVTIKYKIYN